MALVAIVRRPAIGRAGVVGPVRMLVSSMRVAMMTVGDRGRLIRSPSRQGMPVMCAAPLAQVQ